VSDAEQFETMLARGPVPEAVLVLAELVKAHQEIDRLKHEVERLRAHLSEHHAVGALDGALVGGVCWICARAVAEE
jgi:uncharacterized protein YicC (UPF0701 family)